MTEQSRSLLAAAREGMSPSDEVMARVRARVAAAASPPPRARARAHARARALGLKISVVAIVASGVAVGVHRSAAAIDAPQVSLTAPHDEPAGPVLTTASHEPPAHPAIRIRAIEPASLSREVELLDEAMMSLRVRDPDAALAALHTFDRETLGHAQMAEEAAAIGIEAHCALHEDIADRLAAFDLAWPESAERSRIIAACF